MAGIQRPGGTGGAGGRRDALGVQKQQQGLALDALEAEVHVAGQTADRVAVENGVGDGRQTRDQLIPQRRQIYRILLHVPAGLVKSRRGAADAGDILRAGPLAPLLSAAVDDVLQCNAPSGVQHAHALGAVELMGRQGQHIDVHSLDVDGQMSRRLHSVGVEQNAGLLADLAYLRDGLDGADLVVGKHDAHQAGIRPDGGLHCLRRHDTVRRDIQQSDGKSFLLQGLQGVQDGVVLKLGGDDVLLSLPGAQSRSAAQRLVVRLAAAGGKGDLPGLGIQVPCKNLSGLRQLFRRPLARAVEAGRISVNLLKTGYHSLHCRLADSCGCRIIRINVHRIPPFLNSY